MSRESDETRREIEEALQDARETAEEAEKFDLIDTTAMALWRVIVRLMNEGKLYSDN